MKIVTEKLGSATGPTAKKGSKVQMRYIGRLCDSAGNPTPKIFDKNTSGSPFRFTLGRKEVISGWDIGIAGMRIGGERRLIIPASAAYGKQKIAGIPPNSTLQFDVKCLAID